ncbi:addiction module antitoxin [Hyphomicrobium nitrativorans NL23]|uniref:Addiction module antitoxin n=1 Tax=Hyphomicrobium nitrativorans NL23 TaxID=1029756 RepID=V5SEV0_9HYPH|nr:HigA family addiction module antitoxin [Hyphomicrobium nitrativorans]AHB49053.1 addiction module antitoxin [Hyphomicrobium nitrativorans NL23]
MNKSILPPIHPGEYLREEFLVPLKLSPGALAKRLGVPRTRIERIAAEQTGITTDTALRLAKFFKTSPEFWISMQTGYDLKIAEKALKTQLDQIEEMSAA